MSGEQTRLIMGHRQLFIIVLFDLAIAVAIARFASPHEGRALGSFALTGVVALPFAFLATAPLFLSRTSPPVATAPSSAATACPPAAGPESSTGPAVTQLRVVPGWVVGSVDVSQIIGNAAYFCGWAASVKARRVADSILVFADGRLVRAVKPTLSRPDVARAQGGVGASSGFSVVLPLSSLEQPGKKAKVEIYGVERGTATPLPFNCATAQHDFGC